MTNQQIESAVNHPVHYTRGKIECWDFIADHRLDFLRGNVVKYVTRAGFKDERLQDLLKAKAYLKKAMTNSTYPREVAWSSYEPSIKPADFAQDKGLPPALGAVLTLLCDWDLNGAMFYLNQVIAEEQNHVDVQEANQDKPSRPKVYGTDQVLFDDNRKDRRVFEFGKRMGENR